MKIRGLGRVYQPTYIDKKTRERKQTAVWCIQYSFRGKVFRESCGSTRRAAAVKLLKRRPSETSRGHFIGPNVEQTTFEDLAEMLLNSYHVNGRKSPRRAGGALKHLREFFGSSSRAVDITSDRVAAYVRLRQSPRLIYLRALPSLPPGAGQIGRLPAKWYPSQKELAKF